jgi:hypothetical protein
MIQGIEESLQRGNYLDLLVSCSTILTLVPWSVSTFDQPFLSGYPLEQPSLVSIAVYHQRKTRVLINTDIKIDLTSICLCITDLTIVAMAN